jgi:hypothetical protein
MRLVINIAQLETSLLATDGSTMLSYTSSNERLEIDANALITDGAILVNLLGAFRAAHDTWRASERTALEREQGIKDAEREHARTQRLAELAETAAASQVAENAITAMRDGVNNTHRPT